jgi:dihydroorotase
MCDWPTLIQRMTAGPAELLGEDCGTLNEGAAADVTLIDPDKRWTVNVDKFHSRSRNCPYHGWKLKGRPSATIVAGRVVYQA